ncbi:hypothetical protein MMC13_004705 [Lambiella insularis]|nr:hypothetical protein [Lambiella insularis]
MDEMMEVIDLESEAYIDRIDLTFDFDRADSLVRNLDEELSDDEFEKWMANQPKMSASSNERTSNGPVVTSWIDIGRYMHNGNLLYEKTTVEFASGDFMKIVQVLRDRTTDEVFLRGNLYRRMKFMGGAMEKKMNEVLQVVETNQSDQRNLEEQALVSRSVMEVVRRRKLKLTNQPFPALSFREDPPEPQQVVLNERALVARWKYICTYPDAAALRKGTTPRKVLQALQEDECESKYAVKDSSLRHASRGETQNGGAYYDHQTATRDFSADKRRRQMKPRRNRPPLRATSRLPPRSMIDLTYDDIELMKVDTIVSGRKRRAEGADPNSPKRNHILQSAMPSRSRIPAFSNISTIQPPRSEKRSSPAFTATSHPTIEKRRSPSIIEVEADFEHLTLKSRSRSALSLMHNNDHRLSRSSTDVTNVFDESGNRYRSYTYGDSFCGCGGTARGAQMAGLFLKWAFDMEPDMCASYRVNFPRSKVFCMEFFKFITETPDYDAKVDIIHFSCPCQFFSPAHTLPGQNDERNVAASFGLDLILKKAQPRIVTMENTIGLEQRHPMYMNAVIQQFTSSGFSVRWGVVDLRDFGLPQSRRRLILIAACPGEVLPELPSPTHSKYPERTGLKPWTTINQAISDIPTGFADHNIKTYSVRRVSKDGNTQSKCITTSGGNNIHPSGLRPFTVREFACLQGFPKDHMFIGSMTSRKKQVGNAVPPVFAKALYDEIVKTLRKADGIVETNVSTNVNGAPSGRGSRQSEPVLIE